MWCKSHPSRAEQVSWQKDTVDSFTRSRPRQAVGTRRLQQVRLLGLRRVSWNCSNVRHVHVRIPVCTMRWYGSEKASPPTSMQHRTSRGSERQSQHKNAFVGFYLHTALWSILHRTEDMSDFTSVSACFWQDTSLHQLLPRVSRHPSSDWAGVQMLTDQGH